jgi:arylsulfatase A-like enzyme
VSAPAERRPARVLLIFPDQLRWDALPCYGMDFMRTPHLDRMAREGMVFETAYTPSPVCQPARASLMTGLNPLTHRVLGNLHWYPRETPLWSRAATRAGIRTATIGKMHFIPWNDWSGFEDRIIAEDKTNFYRRDNYTLWLEAQGYKRDFAGDHPGYDEGMGAYTSPLPPELHIDNYVGDRAAEWLRAHAHESFFAWVGLPSPHRPYDPPAPLAGLYRDAPIPPALGRAGEMDDKPASQRAYLARTARDSAFRDDPSRLDAALVRHMRAHYLATVTLVDQQVGKMLGTLQDAGVLDDTLIIFTSDHGDALGDHGLMGKNQFYDSTARVPLLVRGPGVKAGARCPALVDTLDLVPTMIEHLGVTFEAPVQGKSLSALFADPAAPHHDAVYSAIDTRAMIRRGRWKLNRHGDGPGEGEGELYDMEADPGELTNLYGRPATAEIRARLESRLLLHTIRSVSASSRFTVAAPDEERETAMARIRARNRANGS